MSAAIDHLLGHQACSGSSVGVVGFCMGGLLTLLIAAQEGDRVAAAAPFYGLRLDELFDATKGHDIFTFDFEADGASIFLTYDDNDLVR